jgi:hypothetical protein
MRRQSFGLAVILVLILVFVFTSSSEAIIITFTGEVTNDFPASAIHGDVVGDVGSPLDAAGPVGWDIESFGIGYDPGSDTLYVGFNMAGGAISGDVDGDGDPGRTSDWLANLNGQDIPDLGDTEAIDILIDIDGSCLISDGNALDYERVGGVSGNGDITTFSVRDFSQSSNDFTTPGAGYSGNAYSGSVFASPSPTQPDLEFQIDNFCTDVIGGGCTPGVTGLSFAIRARAGSLADNGIGEDAVPCTSINFTPTAVTLQQLRASDGTGPTHNILAAAFAVLGLVSVTYIYRPKRSNTRMTPHPPD